MITDAFMRYREPAICMPNVRSDDWRGFIIMPPQEGSRMYAGEAYGWNYAWAIHNTPFLDQTVLDAGTLRARVGRKGVHGAMYLIDAVSLAAGGYLSCMAIWGGLDMDHTPHGVLVAGGYGKFLWTVRADRLFYAVLDRAAPVTPRQEAGSRPSSEEPSLLCRVRRAAHILTHEATESNPDLIVQVEADLKALALYLRTTSDKEQSR